MKTCSNVLGNDACLNALFLWCYCDTYWLIQILNNRVFFQKEKYKMYQNNNDSPRFQTHSCQITFENIKGMVIFVTMKLKCTLWTHFF